MASNSEQGLQREVGAIGYSRAVFLHGMWRSGSTYLWSRFRAANDTCCFYEPLHHGLERLTQERIRRETSDLALANGHPALAAPYFQRVRRSDREPGRARL